MEYATSNMTKTGVKIKSVWDYLNPVNLKTLKECNDIYQNAKTWYKKKDWDKALGNPSEPGYKEFRKKNIVDFDTLIEGGICYYEKAMLDPKNKTHCMDESLRWLLQAQKLRGSTKDLELFLFRVYAAKNDWTNACDYFESVKGRLKPAEIQKLKKKTKRCR